MASKKSSSVISIKEIAQEAGVAPSTVSKVLNGYKKFSIRPEMRERILSIVKERGYTPNPIFKSLRAEKSSQISMLFYARSPFDVGAVVNKAVECMDPLLKEKGYSMNFTFVQKEGDSREFLPPWKVDGIVLSDVYVKSSLDKLVDLGLPFVVLNGEAWGYGPAVIIDEEEGMRQIVSHLRSLGHTRIAYANGKYDMHYSVKAREKAYLKVMEENGLKPESGYDELGLNPADYIRGILSGKATALVTYDHNLAFRYLHAAWDLGIDVPGQLSVAAFTDELQVEFSIPPLTCVASPAEEMGRCVVEILLQQIDSGEIKRGLEVKIPGKLVIRQSTGRVKS